MTSRFKLGLALLVGLAAACVLVLVLGSFGDSDRTSGHDLVADGSQEEGGSDGPRLPADGRNPAHAGGTSRQPGAVGDGTLVGARLPEGIDLSDPDVRQSELRRLMATYPIHWPDVARIVEIMSEPIPAELRPQILEELKSGRRLQVMLVFMKLRDASFVEDLFTLLDDPSIVSNARTAVLTALWQMPGGDRDEVARRLEGRLASDVRKDQGLLQAIAKRGGPEAARALVEYLQRVQRPREVPPHVLQSLDVTDPAASAIVADALRAERSPQVLQQLIQMATQTGASTLVEPLSQLDRDGVDETVRAQALVALGRIGDAAGVEYLIQKSMEPGVFGQHALRSIALVTSTDTKVAAHLAKALSEADSNPRPAEAKKSLLLALGAAKDRKSLPAIAATLGDRDEEVQNAAVQAMERMGHKAGEYVDQVARLFDQGSPRTQLRVVLALGSIGGESAIAALRGLREKKGLTPRLAESVRMALSAAERELERQGG